MSQNRRSFLRRGWKVLIALPIVAAVVGQSKPAEAALFRRRRSRRCGSCGTGGCCPM